MGSWQPPPAKKHSQSKLLLCRRWSTPGLGPPPPPPPPLNLYSHYVIGVNENEARMRELRNRKLLNKLDEEKSREARLRATFEGALRADATAAKILAWSREKYKDWTRRQPRDYAEDGEVPQDGNEVMTPASTVTRKITASRMSRESLVRMRSQSSMSVSVVSQSDTEEEKSVRPQQKSVRTFWWYCGVIKALCKLALDMQRLSMRKTQQTALSELYYFSVSGASNEQEDSQILFFDKTLFTRKRAACRIPEWAQNLMIRRPEDRRPEAVQRLKNLLMSMRSFREKYTDDTRTKICQVVRYTRCDKGRVVLRQGHTGLYFYFIFSGSVFIQITLLDPKTGETTDSTENIIRTGESFGEIALLGDGKRSATVICREPTELCQIDKSTFLEICPDYFQQQLDEKIDHARRFELFDGWDHESVKQLCFVSQILYIPHGRVLELDWSQAQYIYFVMGGRVSMLKEFDVKDDAAAAEEDADPTKDWDWEEELRMEEEEERLSILLASSAGVQLMHKGTPTGKRFACVGTLREGQSTDLRILTVKAQHVAAITLLSEGVKVLRIATHNFKRFAPKRRAEEYLKKIYTPMAIPDTKAIVRRYLRDLSWTTFRKCVTGTLDRTRGAGHLYCTLPASSKGTTGWARWPGFDSHAEEKAEVLSEKGGRSEIDYFPLAKLPPAHELRRRRSARRAGKRPPKITDHHQSLSKASSGSGNTRSEESDVVNDRRLVMFPPPKVTAAFLRRKVINSR